MLCSEKPDLFFYYKISPSLMMDVQDISRLISTAATALAIIVDVKDAQTSEPHPAMVEILRVLWVLSCSLVLDLWVAHQVNEMLLRKGEIGFCRILWNRNFSTWNAILCKYFFYVCFHEAYYVFKLQWPIMESADWKLLWKEPDTLLSTYICLRWQALSLEIKGLRLLLLNFWSYFGHKPESICQNSK